MISCIIPTTIKEESLLPRLLRTLTMSAVLCLEPIEVLVVENGERGKTESLVQSFHCKILRYLYLPTLSRSDAKNFGVEEAKGDVFVFIDADNLCSLNLFSEVSKKAANLDFFGGGCKSFILSRPNLGVYCYFTLMLLIFTLKGIFNPFNPFTVGIFWFKKQAYEEIGGWRDVNLKNISKLLFFVPECYQQADDIDLGQRMKMYEKEKRIKFESLKETKHIWNTRKFDLLGDWSWMRVYSN